jgi:hypothetical protein
MVTGQAVHCAVLEPERFLTDYTAAPKVDKRTKAGKARWVEFELQSKGKAILSPDDHDVCMGISRAISKHKAISSIVEAQGNTEVSIVWESPIGAICKSRLDKQLEDKIVVDLKTSRDASPEGFMKAIAQYSYHRQAAFYLDAAQANTFLFVVIEKTPPFGAAVYRPDDEMIECGRREYGLLLETYKNCVDSNTWPGYPEQVIDIGLPAWKAFQEERQQELERLEVI